MRPIDQWKLRVHAAEQAARDAQPRWTHLALPADPDLAHALILGLHAARQARTASKDDNEGDFANHAYAEAAHTGGFTLAPNKETPKSGYSVSRDKVADPKVNTRIPISEFKPEHIVQHLHDNAHHTQGHANAYLGGWVDHDNSEVHLDVSHVHASEPEARTAAVAHRQKAYYALHSGSEMFLDPTRDPLSRGSAEKRQQWGEKYRHVGFTAPTGYHSYATDLYPKDDDEQAHEESSTRAEDEGEERKQANLATLRQGGIRAGVY